MAHGSNYKFEFFCNYFSQECSMSGIEHSRCTFLVLYLRSVCIRLNYKGDGLSDYLEYGLARAVLDILVSTTAVEAARLFMLKKIQSGCYV